MSFTSRDRRWEILHSLWIGWTFTLGFFNWIAFLYIGLRASQRKWILWGILYAIPFSLAILVPDLEGRLGDFIIFLTLALGVASIIHAFKIRKEYLRLISAERNRTTKAENNEIVETLSSKEPDATSEKPTYPSQAFDTGEPTLSPANKAPVPYYNLGSRAPKIYSGTELEYDISSAYPFPIAFGFRSLASVVDVRDLYREQLRIAENMLAFLASVSLALLRYGNYDQAKIDPKNYWQTGISPGDWKEIIARCSDAFAEDENSALASNIRQLNIRSEKKGFGRDATALIREKNNYKHDRGPTVTEDTREATEEVQSKLRQCMEALSFFMDYPIHQVEDFDVSRRGDEVLLKCLRYTGDHPSFPQEEILFPKGLPRGDLFLDLGSQNWAPLHPFVVAMNCAHCKVKETYFIDAWDQRKSIARMKSFERGHTMPDEAVSEALAEWREGMQQSTA